MGVKSVVVYEAQDGKRFDDKEKANKYQETFEDKMFESTEEVIEFLKDSPIWKAQINDIFSTDGIFDRVGLLDKLARDLRDDNPPFIVVTPTIDKTIHLKTVLWDYFEEEFILSHFYEVSEYYLSTSKIMELFEIATREHSSDSFEEIIYAFEEMARVVDIVLGDD